jgi:uncharacterized protein (TIGR02246 family)
MKIHLLLALAGSAINFALPAVAQQKDTVDPQIAQQIRVLASKYDEAFNRSDSGGLAALFTDDALLVTGDGTFHGREAIAKHYAEFTFAKNQCHNFVRKDDRVNVVGDDVVATGKWTCALHGINGSNRHVDGHYSWVLVREGDTWKIRKDTVQAGHDY